MPENSTGVYSLPTGYLATSGNDILPSQHNPPLEDIAAVMTNKHSRDGRAAALADWNMGGFKLTNLADGVANSDAATVGQAALLVGDFKSTARTLGAGWLRRNGGIYTIATYPSLAALLPALPDGITWSSLSTGIADNTHAINLIGTEFFIVTVVASAVKIYKSTDKVNWNLIATLSSIAWAQVSQIEKFGSTYVIVGVNGSNSVFVSSSTDAVTWSTPVQVNTMNGAGGATTIAFGASIYVVGGAAGAISSSPDLVTWTTRTSGFGTDAVFKIRFLNSNFIALGSTGKLSTSTNGTTWTLQTTGVTTTLYDAAFFGSTYAVVGATGTILTSANLTTWVSRTSGTTSNLYAITVSTSGYVTVGATGVARLSPDAITWSSTTTSAGVDLWAVVFDPSAQNIYYTANAHFGSNILLKGTRTLPTQFQVPNDDPTYGWIKAS